MKMSKKELDYLLIPNSGGELGKERKGRALKEMGNRKIGEVLILDGKDSEEDILYLGKILKKGDRIGFDTFPLHYKEYKVIIKKAVKQEKFPKGVKIENVKTGQNFKQSIYGFFGLEEEKFLHKKIDYMKNRDGKILVKIKNIVKKILNI